MSWSIKNVGTLVVALLATGSVRAEDTNPRNVAQPEVIQSLDVSLADKLNNLRRELAELKVLLAENEKYRAKVEALESKIGDLEIRLARDDARIDSLEASVKEIHATLDGLRAIAEAAHTEAAVLATRTDEMRTMLSGIVSHLESIDAKVADNLRKSIEDAAKLSEEFAVAKAHQEELSKSVQQDSNELRQANAKIAEVTKALEKVGDDIAYATTKAEEPVLRKLLGDFADLLFGPSRTKGKADPKGDSKPESKGGRKV